MLLQLQLQLLLLLLMKKVQPTHTVWMRVTGSCLTIQGLMIQTVFVRLTFPQPHCEVSCHRQRRLCWTAATVSCLMKSPDDARLSPCRR